VSESDPGPVSDEAQAAQRRDFDPAETYQLLRNLTSPLVAITAAADGEANGMISDSAVRASLAPRFPRVGFFLHKFNHTHGIVSRGGVFVLHLLRDDQWKLIHRLGFTSGRDGDKLAGLEVAAGITGCPVLRDCHSAFECRVANRMDAGASTFHLGDVVAVWRGTGEQVMSAARFRAHMPSEWRAEYDQNLRRAQAYAEAHATIMAS
jgi:flavin reductase (DIM6/NTAB) family NADH-FMN oxidoreductase RutF